MDDATAGEPPRPAEPASPASGAQDGLDWLRLLDWHQFEDLIAAAYRRLGYDVLPTAVGADGGIDLILNRGTERIFVQCKHWKAWQVGAPTVRELFGLVVAHGATGGVVVTSGRFSQEAVAFAQQTGVSLLDGPAVLHLVAGGRAAPGPQFAPSPGASLSAGSPMCPICSAPMLLRKARRGRQAGTMFWGCSRYPGCKGVRAADGTPAPSRAPSGARSTQRGRSLVGALTSLLGLVVLMLMAPGFIGNAVVPRMRTAPPVSTPFASVAATHAPNAMGEQPMDIALDPAARRLYTANFVSGDVSVLDADTLLVVDTIDVAGQPVGVAVDPAAHTLYVADYAGRRIEVVDLITRRTLATLTTGGEPADLALDPKRHRLFVANKAEGTVWVYNTVNRRRTATLKVARASGVAVDATDGGVVVLSDGLAWSFHGSRLTKDPVVHMATFARGLALDSLRRRLYTAMNSFLEEQNLLTGKSRPIPIEGRATGVCIDEARRVAYYADPDASVVRRVSLG